MSEIGRVNAPPIPATPATPAAPAAPGAPAPPTAPPPVQAPVGDSVAPRTSELAQGAAADGDAVAAQVAARDGGALVVRTATGTTLVLTGNPKLAEILNQAALQLRLLPGAPPSAVLLTANGANLQPPLLANVQQPTVAQLALAAAAPQAPAAPLVPPAPGQTLAAQVLPGPPPTATPGSTAPPAALPPGAQAQFTLRSIALPGSPGWVAPPSARVGESPAPAPSQTTAVEAPRVSVSPAAAQLAAAQLSANQARVASPAAPLPAPGTLIPAVVTGQGALGQTLLRTPQGLLSLDLPQPLPPGTQLALELNGLVRPSSSGGAPLVSHSAGNILQRLQGGWPLLQQTLEAIRAVNPDLAQRLTTQLLPQPNARLTATALQFMAASALGSAQAWLGPEAARALERAGQGDLLRKLDDDFKDLSKLNQRSGDNDWQALTMPMLVQGKVEAVQIFMRRRREPKRKQSTTRFIVDFNLESTGAIQFDGLLNEKKLDLVLRTGGDFGPAFKLDVTRIFEEALAITGMTGSLRFAEREAPIPWPAPEIAAAAGGPHHEIKA